MAAGKRTAVKRILHQTEATNEPLSGAPPARRTPLTKPAQRKSVTKKPSKALKKALGRAPRKSGARPMTKGRVATPAINRKPAGRGKRR
jgi:hypothetical protein